MVQTQENKYRLGRGGKLYWELQRNNQIRQNKILLSCIDCKAVLHFCCYLLAQGKQKPMLRNNTVKTCYYSSNFNNFLEK